jgi:Domain of unknown function (DUF4352)
VTTRPTARAVGVVVAVVVAATACHSSAAPPSTAPTPVVHRPTPAPTITVVRSGVVVAAGRTATFRAQAGVGLTLRASRPSVSRQRLSSSYGYAPAHGYYVTFTVTLTNTGSRAIDVGPTDFFVRVTGEGKVTTLMGNAPYSGASAQLDATQVDAGQRLSGPLTFDVRRPHGSLSFAPDGSPAVTWTY